MAATLLKSGPFAGLPANDTFVRAAARQSPIIYRLPAVSWPANLKPTSVPLGNYPPGTKITSAVSAKADVLIVLYTEQETMALLDVFTGNADWNAQVQSEWCEYAHNFSKFKPSIANPNANDTLKDGAFGRLAAVQIGGKRVVLYKSDLHPKQDGTALPFVSVLSQLITELEPDYVITTGTAGAIGDRIQCGDVAICTASRFHIQKQYPKFPDLTSLNQNETELTSPATFDPTYVQYAATNFTRLSLPGLAKCHTEVTGQSGYGFVRANSTPPNIYIAGTTNVTDAQSMAVVSADYLTVDDSHDLEGLQPLGIMNDTDDAFLFYAVSKIPAAKRPKCISVRNASEPQMVHAQFPHTTTPTEIVNILKDMAGTVYGIYQYCTTLSSAFACWGVVAGIS